MKSFRILEERWSQPDGRLYHKKDNALQRASIFFNGNPKARFYFRFSAVRFPYMSLDSAEIEYNRQSRKTSTSVTERTLCLVVDLFILLSGGLRANHLTITMSRSHCTTNFSNIIRYRVVRVFLTTFFSPLFVWHTSL